MKYTKDEVLQYVFEEDVKFIRLAFCDVFGRQKNVSVMPSQLPVAFERGVTFDASSVAGFGGESFDLLLHPDPGTLTWLPWRPEHGKVVRMFCLITYPDGTPFECDTRRLLMLSQEEAEKDGFDFVFGAQQQFYLFEPDADGASSGVPLDNAGYMDVAPQDKGENVRREICLTLEKMGITPESSHHCEGPGQNEIDFHCADALSTADNVMTLRSAVHASASRNGLCADFGPKPLKDSPGNGFFVNVSDKNDPKGSLLYDIAGGILDKALPMTLFFDPFEDSYLRLGGEKAPSRVSWSDHSRRGFIRIPGDRSRVQLRSPDPSANPYIVFSLVIRAALFGIRERIGLPEALALADGASKELVPLPKELGEAISLSRDPLISQWIPETVLKAYRREIG